MLGPDVEKIRQVLARERAMRMRVLGTGEYGQSKILEIDEALQALGRIETRLRAEHPEEFPEQGRVFEE